MMDTREKATVKGSRTQKPTKTPKSLFSVQNGQSIRSQLDDATLVLRWIIRSVRSSESPSTFAKQYVLKPTFKNDMFVVSFGLPALSGTPRVLDGAPGVRSAASTWTYHGQRTATAKRDLVNAASYNYLGYVDLEYNTKSLLEHAAWSLPFADDGNGGNKPLENELREELREFMHMPGCVLTASGYAINLVAFPAMAALRPETASPLDVSHTVFLMDSESHSSMFMGAFIACASGTANITKFAHNDVSDLATKLERIYGNPTENTTKNVWVTVEGLYSMDGTIAPLVEIIELKRKYGFRIFIDEAHSFLSVGRTGRGSLEYFMDQQESPAFSFRDVDMLGGTLSKALASVGGFVLSSGEMEEHIEARLAAMKASGDPSIPTMSLIRTLQIMKKPDLISQRLCHLRSISMHVATVLAAKGYCISTTRGGPFIAIIFDTVNRVLEFLRVGRELGLICCGAAYPAAPRGAPRIRLSLTSAHGWKDISEMLELVDQISIQVGVKGLKLPRTLVDAPYAITKEASLQSPSLSSLEDAGTDQLSDAVDELILSKCPPAVDTTCEGGKAIRSAGVKALSNFSLGASGPRWMYGTFSVHMSLENLLNATVKKLVATASKSVNLPEDIQTTLFTDSRVALMSIIAVSMEGLARRRSKNGEKHLVLLPSASGLEVREGAAAAQRDKSTITRWFGGSCNDISTEAAILGTILANECSDDSRVHITIYVDTGLLHSCADAEHSHDTLMRNLSYLLKPLSVLLAGRASRRLLTTTILVKDDCIFASRFSSTDCILNALRQLFPEIFTSPTFKFLIYSSFHTLPHLYGLQGAFCTGSKRLIEKIQFLGPGVMYTAMMPPMTAVLAEESIKQLVEAT